MTTMSSQYRSMVYAAVATFYFYRNDIIPLEEGETYDRFTEKNKAVVDRVFEEVGNVFDYELSHKQISLAIVAYVAPGQSVADHPAFLLEQTA